MLIQAKPNAKLRISVSDNLLLLVLLRLGLLLANKVRSLHKLPQRESQILILLLKAITLANVVKFFLLPIMIWNNHTGEMEKKFNFTLVMGYFVYGLIHVYSGKTRLSDFCNFKCSNRFSQTFSTVVSSVQRRITAVLILITLAVKVTLSNAIATTMEHIFLWISLQLRSFFRINFAYSLIMKRYNLHYFLGDCVVVDNSCIRSGKKNSSFQVKCDSNRAFSASAFNHDSQWKSQGEEEIAKKWSTYTWSFSGLWVKYQMNKKAVWSI